MKLEYLLLVSSKKKLLDKLVLECSHHGLEVSKRLLNHTVDCIYQLSVPHEKEELEISFEISPSRYHVGYFKTF